MEAPPESHRSPHSEQWVTIIGIVGNGSVALLSVVLALWSILPPLLQRRRQQQHGDVISVGSTDHSYDGGSGGHYDRTNSDADSFTTTINESDDGNAQQRIVQRVFSVFMATFACTRLAWVVMKGEGISDIATFVLNRVALLSFMSGFSLVVFYKAELFHKQYFSANAFLPTLKIAFIGANAFLWIVSGTLMVVYAVESQPEPPPSIPSSQQLESLLSPPSIAAAKEGNIFYEIIIFAVIIVDVLLAAGFTVYGIRALILKSRSNAGAAAFSSYSSSLAASAPPSLHCELFASTTINLVFTLCFVCRVVLFALRPLGGVLIPETPFRITGYYVPEVIPALLQLLLLFRASHKEEQNREFISRLYDEDYDVPTSQPQQHQQRRDMTSGSVTDHYHYQRQRASENSPLLSET